MERFYQLYGLRVSANDRLPGLMPLDSPGQTDLRIDLDGPGTDRFQAMSKQLWYASRKDRYGYFAHVWKLDKGAYYRFEYSDGAIFVIDRTGRHIWTSWSPDLSVEDILTYLTGHILGFTLGLRGRLCLHASAVAIDGKAVALTAPGGGGKSTTAAVFAHLGFPVITDDVLVLLPGEKGFAVQPGYPRINLWPGAVAAIGGADTELPRIVPGSAVYTKRYLDLTGCGNRFQSTPLDLAAVYTGRSNQRLARPRVSPVSASDAMITLAAQLYRFPLIGHAALKNEFDLLARLALQIPMRTVAFRRELGRIDQLCQMIVDDIRSLQSANENPAAAVDEAIV